LLALISSTTNYCFMHRRTFVKNTGTIAAGTLITPQLFASSFAKKRIAMVGTGDRGTGMWGVPVIKEFGDLVEFVGLCDINLGRVQTAKQFMNVNCATYTDFNKMMKETKPDLLIVTTVDGTHNEFIVKGMEYGANIITEKPMTTDEKKCQQILDAEKRTGRKVRVTFNYRYSPHRQKLYELLRSGVIGTITSADFHWYLDVYHGADYFRRWHAQLALSGSLFVHKATHHFDLLNWYLDAAPDEVFARGALVHYGRNGPFRGERCKTCRHADQCDYHFDIGRSAWLDMLYEEPSKEDGYVRDACVFRENIDIPDTMSAAIRYDNGVQVSYSLNTFMPIEGYHLAFNGTKGRLEIRDYERQAWDPGDETAMYLIKNFAQRTKIDLPRETEGHGGGDQRLRDLIFKKIDAPEHMRLPDSRAGAMSCLTGIAIRNSIDQRKLVKIADLVKL